LLTQSLEIVTDTLSEVTTTTTGACTAACTSDAETDEKQMPPVNADLARLVEVWPTLPDAIRRGILAMVNAAVPTND
jgi:hypothetical protein